MKSLVRHTFCSFGWPLSPTGPATDWNPAADIHSAGREWVVKFELAGVRAQDIEILVRGRRLTVQGMRRDCGVRRESRTHLMEISYGRFERSIELPCDLESAEIRTEYQDGMLLVAITLRGTTS